MSLLPAETKQIRLVLTLLTLLCVSVQGNEVSQLFGKIHSHEDSKPEWIATIDFDAAYALPEFRNDPDVPAPDRQWLVDLPPTEHQRIRQGAEAFLKSTLRISSEGQPIKIAYTFPDYASDPPEFLESRLSRAVVRVEMKVAKEALTKGITLNVSSSCPLTYLFQTGEDTYLPLDPGATHSYLPFALSPDLPAESPGGTNLFWLGFRHVLPLGLDHTLFLLALFFHKRDLRILILHSLAFTLAHSFSLLVLLLWKIELPWPTAVEAAIAATIIATATANLFSRWQSAKTHWTSLVVFLMGLIHGLGFGSILRDQLQNSGTTGIILANAGIEFAQVSILISAWLLTLGWNETRTYHITRIASYLLIATTGTLWLIKRTGAL